MEILTRFQQTRIVTSEACGSQSEMTEMAAHPASSTNSRWTRDIWLGFRAGSQYGVTVAGRLVFTACLALAFVP